MLKSSLIGGGLLAILFGLIWMGQGSGYFPYPAASFMIDNRPWIGYGAVLAAIGVFMVIAGRKSG